MQIINPATEAIIASVEVDTIESTNQKYELLKKGQPIWNKVNIIERIAIIKKFYELLEIEKEELAITLTNEMGKPLQQS